MDPTERTTEGEGGAASFRLVAEPADAGRRLDHVLAERLPAHSRTLLKKLVKAGGVQVNGAAVKPSHKLEAGEVISGDTSTLPTDDLKPQQMDLRILHEDATVLVIDKPPDLVVHPGSGCRDGTLANALKFYIDDLSDIGGNQRPGIVHRLDKDTSGVMVVAKTNAAHFALAGQFQARETRKEYRAIIEGEPEFDGDRINRPLGRSRSDPSKIVVDAAAGKPAETTWEVIERFEGYTYVRCHPKTGRTHQIRVHLQSIGHPILCDAVYGRKAQLKLAEIDPSASGERGEAVILDRQALHAFALEFDHPLEGRRLRFEAPLPPDLERTLAALRAHRPYIRRKSR